MSIPPSVADLALPQWAYVPGESEKDAADHDTLWQAKGLVPARLFGKALAELDTPARPALDLPMAFQAPRGDAVQDQIGATGACQGKLDRNRTCQPHMKQNSLFGRFWLDRFKNMHYCA